MSRWIALMLATVGGGYAQVRVDVQTQPLQVTIQGSFEGYRHFALARPARFVVDLMGATVKTAQEIPVGVGGVVRVRVAQHQRTPQPMVRVVLDLESTKAFTVQEIQGGGIQILPATGSPQTSPAVTTPKASSSSSPKMEPVDTLQKISKEIMSLRNPPPIHITRLGRDPFSPPDLSKDSLLIPQKARLIGVVENSAGERFALLTDGERNFILREGDRVVQGRVARIGKDFVVFGIYEYGISRTYRVQLSRDEQRK